MSGTSLDGIDAAIVDISSRGAARRIRTLAFHGTPYPAALRRAILGVSNAACHTRDIARLHFLLPELYAAAFFEACRRGRIPPQSVKLIGCHGQTIFHQGAPARFLGRPIASTLQIGDGSVLAERTGIPVISDFRPRDIAAGGTGAPLVPYVDLLLFAHPRRGRVALNIGGIANITAIPPRERGGAVIAFDTGPGNMVIDGLVARMTGGRKRFDRGGRIAAAGRVNAALLDALLKDAYYAAAPPKSAGREQYGEEFLDRLERSGAAAPDLLATAAALTAASIAAGIERFVRPRMPVDDLIASGGGVHNPRIMAYLSAFLPGVNVDTSAGYGVDCDAKEAIAFALLAFESYHRRPANLPAATGARRAVVLGKLSP